MAQQLTTPCLKTVKIVFVITL